MRIVKNRLIIQGKKKSKNYSEINKGIVLFIFKELNGDI